MTTPERPSLVVEMGPTNERYLLVKDETTIGRSRRNTIRIDDPKLSRTHCRIQRTSLGWVLHDTGSRNGIRVDGEAVEAHRLADGERVEIGKGIFLVFRQPEGAGAGPAAVADPPTPPPSRFEPAGPVPPPPVTAAASTAPVPPPVTAAASTVPVGPPAPEGPAIVDLPAAPAATVPMAPLEGAGDGEGGPGPSKRRPRGRLAALAGLLATLSAWSASSILHGFLIFVLIVFWIVHEPERPQPTETQVGWAEVPEDVLTDEEPFESDETLEELPADARQQTDLADPSESEPETVEKIAGAAGPPDVTNPEAGGKIGIEGSLAGGGGGGQGFGEYLSRLREVGLDVAIVVDSTGSMGGVLEAAKASLSDISLAIGKLVPTFRLALLTYRDKGDAYVVRGTPLERNRFKNLLWLETVEAAGGGDHPEAVYEGVDQAVQYLAWRPQARKVIVVIGDAPPHGESMGQLLGLARRFHDDEGVVHTISTGSREVAELGRLASAGGGTSVRLSDSQKVIREILVLAFGARWRDEVERQSGQGDGSLRDQILADHAADAPWLADKLGRTPLYEPIVSFLLASGDRRVVGRLAEMAADPKLPPANRWAAAYVGARLARLRVVEADVEGKTPDRIAGRLAR